MPRSADSKTRDGHTTGTALYTTRPAAGVRGGVQDRCGGGGWGVLDHWVEGGAGRARVCR